MEMRSDGTCSILNDDCPEKKITDCKDCQLAGDCRRHRRILRKLQTESVLLLG